MPVQCLKKPLFHIFCGLFKCFRQTGKFNFSYGVLAEVGPYHLVLRRQILHQLSVTFFIPATGLAP